MKTLLVLSFLVTQSVFATTTIISEKTVTLPVDISTTKVRKTASDYSFPVVKVLIPALADVTLLNHRNTGEGAPCMATYGTHEVDDVIQNDPRTVDVKFKLPHTKDAWLVANVCKVRLTETVEGKIRGFVFTHSRSVDMPDRHVDDCR